MNKQQGRQNLNKLVLGVGLVTPVRTPLRARSALSVKRDLRGHAPIAYTRRTCNRAGVCPAAMQGAAPLPLFTQGAAAQARPGSSIARGATNPSAPGRPAALSDGADLPSTSGAAAQQQQQAVRLARTYLQRGKPHDALATIDRVLVHSPNEPELLHLKATCLEALNSIPAVRAHATPRMCYQMRWWAQQQQPGESAAARRRLTVAMRRYSVI